jgi:GT2 family glycosyltransferase
MGSVDVLLPTRNRAASLIFALSGLAGQQHSSLRVVISDQSDSPACEEPVLRTLTRVIESRGGEVEWHHRTRSLGIAEQRDFLLGRASAEHVLYLDDDVFMEPWVLGRLALVLSSEGCGFAGAFPTGLSFRDDVRPHQQVIEYWDGPVRPEVVQPDSEAWERNVLHRAANAWHVARSLPPGEARLYKVAWIASCIMYDREKLLEVGGFSFWRRLPRFHSGEEVLVQNLLLRRWGGCAILPSGTYHSELPSTVLNDEGSVDGHALELLEEMVARFAPGTVGADRGD